MYSEFNTLLQDCITNILGYYRNIFRIYKIILVMYSELDTLILDFNTSILR